MVLNEKTYVEKAENVIKKLAQNKDNRGNVKMVTTSKLRNILAMTADIYNEVLGNGEKLTDEINSRIDYLRVRCVYEYGRDDKDRLIKSFMDEAEILTALKEINGSRTNYILFQRYIEALVAFHKFYGGQD
ncbi:MAG: type III-A CRISPR-associated protein Csm2 [Lachnospiraceae bacterium]|nr:type III-A CRISPR-associated protein Csm2 [Lachnospiraceae bacterium]